MTDIGRDEERPTNPNEELREEEALTNEERAVEDVDPDLAVDGPDADERPEPIPADDLEEPLQL